MQLSYKNVGIINVEVCGFDNIPHSLDTYQLLIKIFTNMIVNKISKSIPRNLRWTYDCLFLLEHIFGQDEAIIVNHSAYSDNQESFEIITLE